MKLLKTLIGKNWFIPVLLVAALFLRTYRASELTGFYFDQGRDAKVIWDLWHAHKFFLIGPTTGIEGIFLGPFYYYLIAPFYILGNGNPVVVSWFLAFLNVVGIYVIYLTGKRFFSREAGILAAFFITFSLQLTQAHRWLSNPTPLPFLTGIAVFSLLSLIHGSKSVRTWLVLGLSIGLGLQCEAASAVFFIPATLIIMVIYRRSIVWSWKTMVLAGVFIMTLLPQIYFNYRHDNILVNSFKHFLVSDRSFTPVLTDFYGKRLSFYFDAFSQKIMLDRSWAIVFFLVVLVLISAKLKSLLNKPFIALMIIWITPLIFLLFYHGNNGYVWDYYFTGVYSVFTLSLAVILVSAAKSGRYAKIAVGFLISIFLATNLFHLRNYLSAGTDGPTDVVLGSSLKAVDWVYENVGNTPFNVDVYVPPVIPHAYDYLFLWRGTTKYHKLPDTVRRPLLYTLYEQDPPHPERLAAWLKRQAGIASPESRVGFGGITVQKRIRL